MVAIGALWLAILLSAVLVFFLSAIIWNALPWHKTDFKRLPDEAAFREAMGPQNLPAGQYNIPYANSKADLEDPEILKRFNEGPVGFLIVAERGVPQMARNLAVWFLFLLGVSGLVAYVCSRTLGPGAEYLRVFQIAGTVSWAAYGLAYMQEGIWFSRPWSMVGKMIFDALLYGMVTAGVFGWLWP